jgi:Flp pilus assembly protein TadD
MNHEPDAAVTDLTAAIALNPKDGLAYRFRGLAYDAKKDPRRAELDYAALKQIDPTAR